MLATQDVCPSSASWLSDDELMARLVSKRQLIDLQELSFASDAAEFASRNAFDAAGSVSPIDWIRINCHMTASAAANSVCVGESAPRVERSIAAVYSGELGYAHLVVMVRTADAVGERFEEGSLLAQAKESSPGKFFHTCYKYRHAADAAGFAAAQSELVEQNRLKLSPWFDGSLLISGVLDPVGGAAVRNALEPLAGKSGEHDHRGREQRLADALIELAEGNRPAQIQVTSTLETLLGLCGAPAADMEFALPVSSRTVERLACDSSIARVLLDSQSAVIEVGRSRRVVSAPARKALVARDGHCRWPRCERPASWSAAHHVVHWIHGGSTDLDNLVLLCHRHHRMVHEDSWQLVKSEDGGMLAIPPTVTFGPQPRGPD